MLWRLAKAVNKIIYWAQILWYYLYVAGYRCCYEVITVYYRIRWSPWNPWALAQFNQAWANYTKTTMYEDRLKLWDFHTDPSTEDYAEQAYVQNGEIKFFINMFTWKDKLKTLFFGHFRAAINTGCLCTIYQTG